jgi:hypothetical protein
MRALVFAFCVTVIGALPVRAEVAEVKRYPVDDLEGILTRSGVELEQVTSSDGQGSAKVTAAAPTVVRLYETGDIDAENARLIYQAKVRTQDVKGQVYLEMWCVIPGKGEFFSRGLQAPLTGTTEWTSVETPFFLEAGQNPDNVKLNLVIDGTGTAWIDDVRLVKGPLQ